MSVKKILFWSAFPASMVFVTVIGYRIGWSAAMERLTQTTPYIREIAPAYQFIKPLLVCDRLADVESSTYAPLRDKIEAYTNAQIAAGNITDVGVYFRNVETGEWAGVNADQRFHPASLLKVPNMIAILREADMGEDILSETYMADDAKLPRADQFIPPSHTIQHGQKYTVNELVKYMIAYSDNRANHALERFGSSEVLTRVFTDFRIPLGDKNADFTISPRDYTLFLRTLYNATYLSRDLSEKALDYLSQSDYREGIVAGVPASTLVAHKFGNYTAADHGRVVQELHDCGIVYTKNGDYSLCVMTKGADVQKLQAVIAEISKIVFTASLPS
jgi:beta-lactamase class A